MNTHHQTLLNLVKVAPKKDYSSFNIAHYLGTPNKIYGIDTQTKKDIVKTWKIANEDLTYDEYIEVIVSLNRGDSFEEKLLSSWILWSFPKYRKRINLVLLDGLLEHLTGWAEIDNLCQSMFGAEEMLARQNEWEKVLKQFNKSSWVSKRRASLVLLVKPCRESNDQQLSTLAFQNIDALMHEKDILITKAISWLLRELTKQHRNEVTNFVLNNEARLPKIATREVKRKLSTGKK